MKVEIKSACYVEGKACKPGDVVETKYANLLVGTGKAVRFEVKPEAGDKAEYNKRVPDTLETRAKPARKTKTKVKADDADKAE